MGLNDEQLRSHLLNVPNDIDLLDTPKTSRFKFVHGIGSSENMGAAINDISTVGIVYNWPQSDFNLQIVSDNANDNANGAGCRSVIVRGLGFNGNDLIDIEEEIFTDGLTPVSGIKEFFRVNEAFVEKSGTYATTTNLSHEGNITVSTFGGVLVHAIIRVDNLVAFGEAEIARRTTPSNAKGHLQITNVSTASKMPSKYFVWKREKCNVLTPPFPAKRLIFTAPPFVGQSDRETKNPLLLEPNTDIWFSGEAPQGANNEVSVNFEITLKYFDFDFPP